MTVDTDATLWPKLDAAVVSILDTEMGTGSDYTDLQLQSAEAFETWAPDTGPYPRALVSSNLATMGAGGHGDGMPHIDNNYNYQVVIVAKAETYADARASAQVLIGRAREALRSNYAQLLGIAGDDGEISQDVAWEESGIETRGRNTPGSTVGEFFGVAVLLFTVEATI